MRLFTGAAIATIALLSTMPSVANAPTQGYFMGAALNTISVTATAPCARYYWVQGDTDAPTDGHFEAVRCA